MDIKLIKKDCISIKCKESVIYVALSNNQIIIQTEMFDYQVAVHENRFYLTENIDKIID
jgi:hypothetical protein